MPALRRKLLLHCDALNAKFTLVDDGEHWRQTFNTFDDAYEQAEVRVADPTPLILYNERGQVIMETTVSPLPSELVSFRHPLKGNADRRKRA